MSKAILETVGKGSVLSVTDNPVDVVEVLYRIDKGNWETSLEWIRLQLEIYKQAAEANIGKTSIYKRYRKYISILVTSGELIRDITVLSNL